VLQPVHLLAASTHVRHGAWHCLQILSESWKYPVLHAVTQVLEDKYGKLELGLHDVHVERDPEQEAQGESQDLV